MLLNSPHLNNPKAAGTHTVASGAPRAVGAVILLCKGLLM